jgi:hypothetical protein
MKQKRSEFSRKFREIILEFLPGRTATIGELRAVMIEHGLWDEAKKETLLIQAMNAQVRREARKRIKDRDGVRREVFNVIRDAEEGVEKQQFFVFDNDIEREDLEYVIRDRARKHKFYGREYGRLLTFYESKFGKKARTRFERQLDLGFVVAN